jgi:hypothetical protein
MLRKRTGAIASHDPVERDSFSPLAPNAPRLRG